MSFLCIGKLTWFEFPLPYVSKFLYGRGKWDRSHKKSKNTIGDEPIIIIDSIILLLQAGSFSAIPLASFYYN